MRSNSSRVKPTTELLREHVHWPGMKRDVRATCRVCSATKPTATAAALKPTISDTPLAVVAFDHMGPYGRTNNNAYILVITDVCTRWTIAIPCRDNSAKRTLEILEREWCFLYGNPEVLIIDNHPGFLSATFQDRRQQCSVKKKTKNTHTAANSRLDLKAFCLRLLSSASSQVDEQLMSFALIGKRYFPLSCGP